MKIPFYDYARMNESEKDYVWPRIMEVLKRSDFILRDDLVEFEIELAKYIDAKHVIGVGNGTDAIWLALIAAGIEPGDEVIIPSHTYIATADAVRFVGGIPVLVDCDVDHSISVQAIDEAVTSKTRAVIPVNLNGRACDLFAIVELANKKGLKVIEDNAQGLGAKLRGKSTGTFGIASTLSFYPAKNLGCYGDGGAVVTDSDSIGGQIRALRNHGRNEDGEVIGWGFNSRLDNLQAAVLNSKLPHLDSTIERRRLIATQYCNGLADVEQIRLPNPPSLDTEYFDSFQNFEIEADQREELREYLRKEGIGTILPWAGKAIHEFGLAGVKSMDLSNTDRLFRKIMLLPMNQYLTDYEVELVIKSIRKFYKHD
jgi:dTDP-4-amino-4,6-dideoxygalactose transaminase